jgi:hypothetical protein
VKLSRSIEGVLLFDGQEHGSLAASGGQAEADGDGNVSASVSERQLFRAARACVDRNAHVAACRGERDIANRVA